MQDFVYIKNDVLIPLPDAIEILDQANDKEVLVCNDKNQKAQIYAPEINFYLKNSQDEILEQSKNVLTLYKARASVYDLGLDLEQSKEVQNRLILADSDTQTVEFLKEHGFKVIALSSVEILAVFGSVGELCAVVKNQGEEVEIDFDFLLFKAEDLSAVRKDFTRQSGCYNLLNFENLEVLLEFLQSKSPKYHYKTYINRLADKSPV